MCAGGQNVYVGQLARHLVQIGYDVDVFTRRDSVALPEVAEWVDGFRIVNVPRARQSPSRNPVSTLDDNGPSRSGMPSSSRSSSSSA